MQIGMTKVARAGCSTSTPSTALSTEIAGVIMLSPSKRAAPNKPNGSSQLLLLVLDRLGLTSVVRARIPPSPFKSACKITIRYLIDTMITSDQMIKEMTPITLAGSAEMPARCEKQTWMV